jgi:hypothetical protein
MRILPALLAVFRSVFRSRAALELENVAPPPPAQCPEALREAAPVDAGRPLLLGCAVASLARLAISPGHRPTGHGHRLASQRLSPFLDMEDSPRETRPTGSLP